MGEPFVAASNGPDVTRMVPTFLAHCPPAATPPQVGTRGLCFDVNPGCGITLPKSRSHVRVADLDAGNARFGTDPDASLINSTKRYCVRFRIELVQQCTRLMTADQEIEILRLLSNAPTGLPASALIPALAGG
ncbi:MAG TPA: hypothetical protein VK726_09095 [Acetobacteraceae bacterium]|jgi:hypothetical protein|nr:hypothetical protein [Acetobacteraceae bacterium]